MFHKIINLIKINYLYKNDNIKLKINKKDLIFINFFIKFGVIKHLKFLKSEKKFLIKFNYCYNEPVYRGIKNMYQPSKPKFINLKNLTKINKKNNSIYILSTNKGLITNFEAEKNKIGGILIFRLII